MYCWDRFRPSDLRVSTILLRKDSDYKAFYKKTNKSRRTHGGKEGTGRHWGVFPSRTGVAEDDSRVVWWFHEDITSQEIIEQS
jgi:hypothetical protein